MVTLGLTCLRGLHHASLRPFRVECPHRPNSTSSTSRSILISPLFVDPIRPSASNQTRGSPTAMTWSCLTFSWVVDSIRDGRADAAGALLSRLREPNDTHFGFSQNAPRGRGIGPGKADLLYQRLLHSEAVRTGNLRDLADCELVIPGIGPDSISDITINVIRRLAHRLHTEPMQPPRHTHGKRSLRAVLGYGAPHVAQ